MRLHLSSTLVNVYYACRRNARAGSDENKKVSVSRQRGGNLIAGRRRPTTLPWAVALQVFGPESHDGLPQRGKM